MGGLSNDTTLCDDYMDWPKLSDQKTHLSI